MVLFLPILLSAFGCSSSNESARSTATEGSRDEFIGKYEKFFNPSRYNPDIEFVKTEENSLFSSLHSASVFTTAQPETIPGFRIQVILTQEIEEAMSVRDSLTNEYPDQLVYVVYDSPYYKIRIGNYPDRTSANSLVKQLNRLGFKDAWIVPDNVLKNPPAKLPEDSIEPKNPIQYRR